MYSLCTEGKRGGISMPATLAAPLIMSLAHASSAVCSFRNALSVAFTPSACFHSILPVRCSSTKSAS